MEHRRKRTEYANKKVVGSTKKKKESLFVGKLGKPIKIEEVKNNVNSNQFSAQCMFVWRVRVRRLPGKVMGKLLI